MERPPMFMIGRINIVKMAKLLKAIIYRFNAMLIKVPMPSFFIEKEKINPKIHMDA
jgi:hypothetical protein